MKLYVKTWCSWCVEAIDWLTRRDYSFEQVDVLASREDYDRMIEISGQRKTPTLELGTGEVLADFDVGQLEKFLKVNNIRPQ